MTVHPRERKYKPRGIWSTVDINVSSNHFIYKMYKPDAAALQYEADDCQFDHILSQLEQQWSLREQVARALKQANAAFAAQFSQPDGYTFMQTCDELLRFLSIKIPLEHPEQKLVVQVLQIACAMHENAVNNPLLTPTQRSSHYLAIMSLVPLCKSALESNVTDPDLWCEVFHLTSRVELAHTKATNELDLSKYLDLDDLLKDDQISGPEDATSGTSAAASPTPAPAKSVTSAPSKAATQRGSVHDITADTRLTPRSAKLREKALAMLNDTDEPYTGKTAPLGRRHTMPTLQTASAPYPARMSAGRTSSKARPRGHALHAVQETEE